MQLILIYSDNCYKCASVSCDLSLDLTGEATAFDISYPSRGKIEFKVSGTSDYLLIDNSDLTTGTPSGGNSEFDVINESQYTNYKISPDCYIAFDGNGDIHGPCSLSQGDDEARMSLIEA